MKGWSQSKRCRLSGSVWNPLTSFRCNRSCRFHLLLHYLNINISSPEQQLLRSRIFFAVYFNMKLHELSIYDWQLQSCQNILLRPLLHSKFTSAVGYWSFLLASSSSGKYSLVLAKSLSIAILRRWHKWFFSSWIINLVTFANLHPTGHWKRKAITTKNTHRNWFYLVVNKRAIRKGPVACMKSETRDR